MSIPQDRKYVRTHEWVKIQNETAYVGITDHAQEELGDIVFVELPDEGDEVKKGGETATVESVKASSPIYSPVSGKISGVNADLADKPELLNEKPYEAFLFKIENFKKEDLADLLDAAGYEKFLSEEISSH